MTLSTLILTELLDRLLPGRLPRRPTGVAAGVAGLAVIARLVFEAAGAGEQLRTTQTAEVVGPALWILLGTLWAFLVMYRVAGSVDERETTAKRLGAFPLSSREITVFAYLPVALPLFLLTAASAVPLVVLAISASMGFADVLVPLVTGAAMSGWAFVLSRLVVRPRAVGHSSLVSAVALIAVTAAYVHMIVWTATMEPAEPVPVHLSWSPVYLVLGQQGSYSLVELAGACCLLGLAVAALYGTAPSRRRLAGRPLPGRTDGMRRRHSEIPVRNLHRCLARLMWRQPVFRLELLLAVLVGTGLAYLGSRLIDNSRPQDASFFLYWAAAFPSVGLVVVRAVIEPTRVLIQGGVASRDLRRVHATLVAAWGAIGLTPVLTLLVLSGAPWTPIVRTGLVGVGAIAVAATVAHVVRRSAMTSTGRTLGAGAIIVVHLVISTAGLTTASLWWVLAVALMASLAWTTAARATTKRMTVA